MSWARTWQPTSHPTAHSTGHSTGRGSLSGIAQYVQRRRVACPQRRGQSSCHQRLVRKQSEASDCPQGAVIEREGPEAQAYLRLPPADFDWHVSEVFNEQLARTHYLFHLHAKLWRQVLALLQGIRTGWARVARKIQSCRCEGKGIPAGETYLSTVEVCFKAYLDDFLLFLICTVPLGYALNLLQPFVYPSGRPPSQSNAAAQSAA